MLTATPLIALLDPDEPTTSDDFDTIWYAYAGPPGYGYLVCDAETIGNAPDSFSFGGDTHRVAQ